MAALFFGCWRCLCTTLTAERADVSAQCPAHGDYLLGHPEAVQTNVSPGFRDGREARALSARRQLEDPRRRPNCPDDRIVTLWRADQAQEATN